MYASSPHLEVALVAPVVGVDDDFIEVHIRSHGKGEDGGEKISHAEQNIDIQQEEEMMIGETDS